MKRRRRPQGFTLIEVLFAIFLVAACAGIVAATMPVATISRGKANLLSKATGLAQKQMEAIRGAGYANANPTQLASVGLIDTATPNPDGTYPFTNSDVAALDNPATVLPQGTGSVKLEQIDVDLVRVTVTVKYNDTKGMRTVPVGTVIANL